MSDFDEREAYEPNDPKHPDWPDSILNKLDEEKYEAKLNSFDEPGYQCVGCKRAPAQIQEYVDAAHDEGITPSEWVRSEEGTFNKENGHFWCTNCYIKAGMPLGKAP